MGEEADDGVVDKREFSCLWVLDLSGHGGNELAKVYLFWVIACADAPELDEVVEGSFPVELDIGGRSVLVR